MLWMQLTLKLGGADLGGLLGTTASSTSPYPAIFPFRIVHWQGNNEGKVKRMNEDMGLTAKWA